MPNLTNEELTEFLRMENDVLMGPRTQLFTPFFPLFFPSISTIDPDWFNETAFLSIVAFSLLSVMAWTDANWIEGKGEIFNAHYPNYKFNYSMLCAASFISKAIMVLIEFFNSDLLGIVSVCIYLTFFTIFVIWSKRLYRGWHNMLRKLEYCKEICVM